MLSLLTDGEWVEIKFEVETNSKWTQSQILQADVISLVIQPLAVGILGVIGCFVAIIGTAAVSIVSSKTRKRLLFFSISTKPPKRLLDYHIFGYTHHWSHRQYIVVPRNAEPLRGLGPVGRTYQLGLRRNMQVFAKSNVYLSAIQLFYIQECPNCLPLSK